MRCGIFTRRDIPTRRDIITRCDIPTRHDFGFTCLGNLTVCIVTYIDQLGYFVYRTLQNFDGGMLTDWLHTKV